MSVMSLYECNASEFDLTFPTLHVTCNITVS